MKKQKRNWSVLLGAAFLMATSAVGPGFLTQTTVFTQQLMASFGFVILLSIILDIGVQLNVWRVIAVSERRAQDIANLVLPGLGVLLSLLIVLGGLAFNIGNVGGAGLGLNVLFGISAETGAMIAAAVAIGVFLMREAGKVMDRFAQVMGFLMILLILFVAFTSAPPVGEAVAKTFMPDEVDVIAIITLVGGTVGGYITFAGGHRLLDAGIKGRDALSEVSTSAVMGISVASLIRVFLFLAALGVVSKGLTLDPANPPASVFQQAAGNLGYKLFGVVMLSAAITSVIGSAYTSVSFLKSFSPKIQQHENWVIIGFILVSTAIFITIGQPVRLLILAGALNGLILPLSLGTMLFAAYKPKIVGDYRHPLLLTVFGVLVVLVMAYLGGYTLWQQIPKLFA
ncbi:NRAMP family divalent metal transporter [Pontibacter akesuensis]|uniref:Mn2+ and Fe2+ transporters of the NRAMP family n=1 Tax=Pontibacter akesuensis TaxID=388950 RepID=A0A1I7GQ15_9BACT|nr:NRAMP family divalent metal transporter [Pontibacter akesuensis]GHA55620.1 putative membrane protein YcsG [Pontibacter akesuensis]SFU50540.1 Mn2+ and Fe2+ transporters of the NRAMP family [Pontibacter akesuensis]